MSDKKVLVTGAAGFIGAVVSRFLLEKGEMVLGVDNLNDYYDPELKQFRLRSLVQDYGDKFTFHKVDIENRDELFQVLNRYEISKVINLAARAGVRSSMEIPAVYFSTNVMGTLNVLDYMREHKIKKIITASTSSVYAGLPLPFNETQNCSRPLSPYAASKMSMESLCFSYHHNFGLDVVVPRFFTVYGPMGRPDMSYFKFISSVARDFPITILGDGEQKRDFTHVHDVARAILRCLDLAGFNTINLGNDNPRTVNEMIRIVEGLLGRKAKVIYRPSSKADMPATWADISKAKKMIQWSPAISLEDGLADVVRWFSANEWSYEIPLIES